MIIPLPAACSPWVDDALNGAAVAPLVATLAEQQMTQPAVAAHIAINLLRPVPARPLAVEIHVERDGSKQKVVRMAIGADGKHSVLATVTWLRCEMPEGAAARQAATFVPPGGLPFAPGLESQILDWVDSRILRSNSFGLGTTEGWFRYRGTIIEGEPLTPLARTALFADFGNGLAPIVDPQFHSYANADLSIHLARLPQGEWLKLDAETIDGSNGLAMVCTRLADSIGPIGWAHQSLIIESRRLPASDLIEESASQ